MSEQESKNQQQIDVHYEGGGLFPQNRGWYWKLKGAECSLKNCHGPSDAKEEAETDAQEALENIE